MPSPEGRPFTRNPVRTPSASCGCDGCCSGSCGTSDSYSNLTPGQVKGVRPLPIKGTIRPARIK